MSMEWLLGAFLFVVFVVYVAAASVGFWKGLFAWLDGRKAVAVMLMLPMSVILIALLAGLFMGFVGIAAEVLS